MSAVKIVVVLEVMWGLRGDRPRRWFEINPYNHSGRRLISLVGHEHFVVTNACPDVVYSATGRGTPSKKWLQANLGFLQPDVLLLCGNVAQSTFEEFMAPNAKVLRLMHPAARTWSMESIKKAKRQISRAINSHQGDHHASI